jgi:hypothetical protein
VSDEYQDDGVSTVSQDLFLNLLLLFVFLLLVVVSFITPNKSEDHKSPGDLTIEMSWPHDSLTDFDLWAKSPTDERATYYGNKQGATFDLLRDDIGADVSNTNIEYMFAKATPYGRYIINVNQYRRGSNVTGPEDVWVQVNFRKSGERSFRKIYQGFITFDGGDKEKTVVQFDLIEGRIPTFSDLILDQEISLK